MFRIPLLVALALAIAFGGGIASAVWALKATVGFGSISIGPWVAFPEAQTENADPMPRHIAPGPANCSMAAPKG